MKEIIWLDPNVDSDENKEYFNELNKLGNYKISRIKTISQTINKLNEILFEETIIIVSGKLYNEFIVEFKNNINNICFIPNIIIFTANQKEFLDSINPKFINDSFYNSGGVVVDFGKVIQFVKNPRKKNNILINRDDEGQLCFDYIDTKEKLALPIFYKHLIEFTEKDNQSFIKFLYQNYYYKSKEIRKFIDSISSIKEIPMELLAKFYSRIYTDEESKFYSDLNKDLRQNKKEKYLAFIKVLYEGVKLKSLPLASNTTLFRGAKLTKNEIEKIEKYYNIDKNKKKDLPGAIIFSRAFLSFTKEKQIALNFFNQTPGNTPIGNTNNILTNVLFILEKDNKTIDDDNINYSLSTHADIEKLSLMPDEKEVLFFPFSSFEIKDIKSKEKIQKDYTEIYLLYLGKYLKKIIEKDNILVNQKIALPKTEFKDEIIKSGLIKQENDNTQELIEKFKVNKQVIKKIKNPIYQINPIYPIYNTINPIYNPIYKKPYIIRRFERTETLKNENEPIYSPKYSPINSLINTPKHSPLNSPKHSPLNSPKNSPINSPSISPSSSTIKNIIPIPKINLITNPSIIPLSSSNDNKNKNFIIGQIFITKNDINKNIRIINSFEQAKKKYNYIKVDNELRYKNEKEIENCEIKINGKKIQFSYFFLFKNPGVYTIEYYFKSNLTKTDFMFSECFNLISLDLFNFNCKNVTNMVGMFLECISLRKLKISNLDTQNVNDMNCMFCGCQSLKNLDLSFFNTQKVVNMSRLFFGCKSLENINLSSFNTQNVVDMYGMFGGCESLLNLDLLNFYTQNVVNMSRMFFGCRSLKTLNLSNFRTNKVAYTNCMFYGCTSLIELNIASFNLDNIINKQDMFIGCLSLKIENIIYKNRKDLI